MNMAGGSFWAAFGVRFANTASTIDSILNRASFTIEDLLDEDDVIQECKFGNNSLIDYLSQPDVLEKLIQFVIMTPEAGGHPSDQDKSSSKYPYMASELFACENLTILDALFSEPRLLKLLFSFLDNKPPLNPSCSGYFRKVVVVLIQKKYLQLVNFLKTQPDFVTRMVDHVGLYSIMELLIMIGWDDGLGQVNDFPWLFQENVVPKLVAKLDPAYDQYPEVQCNAARALVDVVVKCPVGQNNVLVSHLLSPSVLEVIFRHMFSGSASSLTNALSVVTVLVQRTSTARDEGMNPSGDQNASADSSAATTPTAASADHSDSDNEHEEKKKETTSAAPSEQKSDKPHEEALPPLISMLLEHLPKLAALLVTPPLQRPTTAPTHRTTASARLARRRLDSTVDQSEPELDPSINVDDAEVERDPHGNPIPAPSSAPEPQPVVIRTQFGELKPPLGETRIKAVELFLVLCASNYTRVNAELVKLQVLSRTLDLFFSYPWNNMLHTLVENIVHTVLLSDTSLRQALFEDARLIDRLIDSQEQNQKVGQHISTRENGVIRHQYRAGYMGHVIRMCDTLAQNREPSLAKYLGEYARWVRFISPAGGLSYELNVQRTQIGGPRPGSQIEEDMNSYMTHETDSGGGMGMGLGLGLMPSSLTKDDDHDNDGSDSDDHESDEQVYKGYSQDGKDGDSNDYGQKNIQISELIHNFAAEYDEEDYHRSLRADVDENDIEADVGQHNGNGSGAESAGSAGRRARDVDDLDEDGDGDDPMDQMASRATVEHGGDHEHDDSDEHDDSEHGHHPARRRPSFEEDEEAMRANQTQGRAQVATSNNNNADHGDEDEDEDDVVYTASATEEALPAPVTASPVKSGSQSQQGSAAASARS